jgi:hypothetical protein
MELIDAFYKAQLRLVDFGEKPLKVKNILVIMQGVCQV